MAPSRRLQSTSAVKEVVSLPWSVLTSLDPHPLSLDPASRLRVATAALAHAAALVEVGPAISSFTDTDATTRLLKEAQKQRIHLQCLYDIVISLVYEVQLGEDAFEEVLHLMDMALDNIIILAANERTMEYAIFSLGLPSRPSLPLSPRPYLWRFAPPFPHSFVVPSSPLPPSTTYDLISSRAPAAPLLPEDFSVVSSPVAPSSSSHIRVSPASPAAPFLSSPPVISSPPSIPPTSITPHGLFFLAWRVLVMFLLADYFFSNDHTMNYTQDPGSLPLSNLPVDMAIDTSEFPIVKYASNRSSSLIMEWRAWIIPWLSDPSPSQPRSILSRCHLSCSCPISPCQRSHRSPFLILSAASTPRPPRARYKG